MAATGPAYLNLLESGELARRAREAVAALADCVCCPRQCHADRRQPDSPESYCRIGRLALVSNAFPHHGEENCLRGRAGSGTIFFAECNLRCVFCHNFGISWQGHGQPISAANCP
jgi:putative pyruvate formate lyase activating enzyme